MQTVLNPAYYNATYFDWQKDMGAFGGLADLFKFSSYVKSTDRVIDFGSGGGFLLKNLRCRDKIGLEINASARAEASTHEIKSVANADYVPDDWADVIISNHALEHVTYPLHDLKKLYHKLKPNGKIIFVTALERSTKYDPNDVSKHLYTWSEMNLGNLFTAAGFDVIEVQEIKHRWPPKSQLIWRLAGKAGFDLASRIYARLRPGLSQVRIVAEKR